MFADLRLYERNQSDARVLFMLVSTSQSSPGIVKKKNGCYSSVQPRSDWDIPAFLFPPSLFYQTLLISKYCPMAGAVITDNT